MSALAAEVLTQALAQGHVIATAESCTGGMIFAALTDLPGSSAVMDRGFVTYSNQAKREMLGVQAETLEAHGAVSEHVAQEMVAGAFAASPASIAIAVTGIAGPGGSEHKPEGRVCFGLAWDNGLRTETVDFGPLGRSAVRAATVDHALRMILTRIAQDVHDKPANKRGNAQNLGS